MPSAPGPLIYQKDYANKRAVLTFNRPEVMNSINPELGAAFRDAVDDFNNDDGLWLAILTGAGDRAFCAGADLGSTIPNQTAAAHDEELAISEDRPFTGVFKPIIAAVNGYCIAGGMEIMLGTDIRVAAETAEFGLQEVRWAIVPSAGSHLRLPRQIPWAWAMEILLTGQRLKAQQALQIGLINRVVAQEDVLPTAHAIADKICANGPIAVRTAKEIAVRGAMGMSWEHAFGMESLLSRRVFSTEDAVEGPKSFMEQRPPVYKNR